jgi:small nuclear ribonucleoprotein (snRNP)-like protein
LVAPALLLHPNATRGGLRARGVQVQVTDGRVFVGRFHCLDPQGNLLLSQTVEHRRSEGAHPSVEERSLGLVLVPVAHRVSACFEVSLAEAGDAGFLDPHSASSPSRDPAGARRRSPPIGGVAKALLLSTTNCFRPLNQPLGERLTDRRGGCGVVRWRVQTRRTELPRRIFEMHSSSVG